LIRELIPQLWSITALAIMALACLGVGRPLARSWQLGADETFRPLWEAALGLVFLGCLLTLAGLCGILVPFAVQLVSFAAAVWGALQIGRDGLQRRKKPLSEGPAALPLDDLHTLPEAPLQTLFALLAIAVLGTMLTALAPPTAGDALAYHLELPKHFLAHESLIALPDHEQATYPLLVEMWYLWALALDGPVAAQLVAWGLGILLFFAAVALAEPILGQRWAWVAGTLAALTPGLTNGMTAPLNDVPLAAMTTLTLAAWWRGIMTSNAGPWLRLAAIFGGASLGIKFNAILFLAVIFAVWLVVIWRAGNRSLGSLREPVRWAALALVIGGGWYLRALWITGNPVFPYFNELFGLVGPLPIRPEKRPLSGLALLMAPWELTMHPDRFGGRAHQWGPLFLAMLPGLLMTRRVRGVGWLLLISALYFALCLVLRQNVRFFYPLIPLLAIPVAWVWCESQRFRPTYARVVSTVVILVLLASSLITVRRARETWPVALGWESRIAYLCRREPTFVTAQIANRLLPSGSRILSQELRAFYFQAEVVREVVFRRRTDYACERKSGDWLKRVRESGFSHLLLATSDPGSPLEYDRTLLHLVEQKNCSEFREIFSDRAVDADGLVRHYRLLELLPVSNVAQRVPVLRK